VDKCDVKFSSIYLHLML